MDEQKERRAFVRLNLLADVLYRKITPSEKERLSLIKNVSKGGICLIAYEELKKHEELELDIYLPEDNTPIHSIGRVAWVKEFSIGDTTSNRRFDVGIEFIMVNDKDMNKIDKYIFSHAKD